MSIISSSSSPLIASSLSSLSAWAGLSNISAELSLGGEDGWVDGGRDCDSLDDVGVFGDIGEKGMVLYFLEEMTHINVEGKRPKEFFSGTTVPKSILASSIFKIPNSYAFDSESRDANAPTVSGRVKV